MVVRGKCREGRIGKLGLTYTLLFIKELTNKDLLYTTGNSTQYSIMIYMAMEWIYVYIELIHFAVQQKLTQLCKSTTLQKIFFKKRIHSILLPSIWRSATHLNAY